MLLHRCNIAKSAQTTAQEPLRAAVDVLPSPRTWCWPPTPQAGTEENLGPLPCKILSLFRSLHPLDFHRSSKNLLAYLSQTLADGGKDHCTIFLVMH